MNVSGIDVEWRAHAVDIGASCVLGSSIGIGRLVHGRCITRISGWRRRHWLLVRVGNLCDAFINSHVVVRRWGGRRVVRVRSAAEANQGAGVAGSRT